MDKKQVVTIGVILAAVAAVGLGMKFSGKFVPKLFRHGTEEDVA